MKRLLLVAFAAMAMTFVVNGCHKNKDTQNPATMTVDAGPTEPEHHYPRE